MLGTIVRTIMDMLQLELVNIKIMFQRDKDAQPSLTFPKFKQALEITLSAH